MEIQRGERMNYEKIEEQTCQFNMYLKQTMDLLKDAYRWKTMANECDNEDMKSKYMSVSNTLYQMFMEEHNNIGNMFKE